MNEESEALTEAFAHSSFCLCPLAVSQPANSCPTQGHVCERRWFAYMFDLTNGPHSGRPKCLIGFPPPVWSASSYGDELFTAITQTVYFKTDTANECCCLCCLAVRAFVCERLCCSEDVIWDKALQHVSVDVFEQLFGWFFCTFNACTQRLSEVAIPRDFNTTCLKRHGLRYFCIFGIEDTEAIKKDR